MNSESDGKIRPPVRAIDLSSPVKLTAPFGDMHPQASRRHYTQLPKLVRSRNFQGRHTVQNPGNHLRYLHVQAQCSCFVRADFRVPEDCGHSIVSYSAR